MLVDGTLCSFQEFEWNSLAETYEDDALMMRTAVFWQSSRLSEVLCRSHLWLVLIDVVKVQLVEVEKCWMSTKLSFHW